MVYIGPDGNVSQNKPKLGFFRDILAGIISFLGLLIGSITGNPNAIRANPNNSINARRNRVRGSNIRSVKNLGTADAKCGAGG